MIAEPAVQLRLLDLQALDSRLAQIEHKRRSLPQLATIADLEGRIAALRDRIVAGQTEVDDLERALAKAETDVEQVRARAAKDQELLDSGRVSSSRELENLQHEIASLARRQGDLEEAELEVMERLEEARGALGTLTTERDGLRAELDAATAERDESWSGGDRDKEWLGGDDAVAQRGEAPVELGDRGDRRVGAPLVVELAEARVERLQVEEAELDCGLGVHRTPRVLVWWCDVHRNAGRRGRVTRGGRTRDR